MSMVGGYLSPIPRHSSDFFIGLQKKPVTRIAEHLTPLTMPITFSKLVLSSDFE